MAILLNLVIKIKLLKKQQANIVKPILQINGIHIESADHLYLLELNVDSHMLWTNHTTNISNECS